MVTVILILQVLIIIAMGFIIRTLFGMNANVIDNQQKIEAFIKAFNTNYEEEMRVRKLTANVLDKLSKNLFT